MPCGSSRGFAAACSRWGATGVRRLHQRKFRNPEAAARRGLDRTFIVEVPAGTDAAEMAAEFAALSDEIEFAAVDPIGTIAELIPDDAGFVNQYGMHNTGQTGGTDDADIDAPEAWDIHTGNLGTVTIAIVDTGVSPHDDFGGRLVPGINTVGDGEFTDVTTDQCDPGAGVSGHGTHVAGIAAAQGNNGIGVAGVTWGANIMPVKVFGGCSGTATDTAEGIIWAVENLDNPVDIINISLQFRLEADLQPLLDAVNYAHDLGVLVVSAAGNDDFCGVDTVCAPARFENSMAVSATDNDDQLWFLSNTGDELDVSAPGKAIYSTFRIENNYGFLSGTSMATPHVSGLAALIKSLSPTLTHDEIRDIITATAHDLGPLGWDNQFGFGRINAYDALLEAGEPRILNSVPPNGAIDARQPSDPDGANDDGWQWVDLTFAGNPLVMTAGDFAVAEDPPSGVPLAVIWVDPKPGFFRIFLNRKITPGAWTTITHLDSGTFVRLGYMPGDADGNGTSNEDDITALADALSGEGDPMPLRSFDLDRSGTVGPRDILREIDLLNGAASYDAYLGETLPP